MRLGPPRLGPHVPVATRYIHYTLRDITLHSSFSLYQSKGGSWGWWRVHERSVSCGRDVLRAGSACGFSASESKTACSAVWSTTRHDTATQLTKTDKMARVACLPLIFRVGGGPGSPPSSCLCCVGWGRRWGRLPPLLLSFSARPVFSPSFSGTSLRPWFTYPEPYRHGISLRENAERACGLPHVLTPPLLKAAPFSRQARPSLRLALPSAH